MQGRKRGIHVQKKTWTFPERNKGRKRDLHVKERTQA